MRNQQEPRCGSCGGVIGAFEHEVHEALDAIYAGIEDARGDFPEVHEDDIAHDITVSICSLYAPLVATAVRRRMGF